MEACYRKLAQLHTADQISQKVKNGNKEFEEGNALQLTYYFEEILNKRHQKFNLAYLGSDYLADVQSTF